MPLGLAYHGTGTADAALAAVRKTLSDAEMAVTESGSASEALILVGRQRRSWIEVLTRALPQKVTWRIVERGRRLEIASDFEWFGWYRAVFLALAATGGCGVLVGNRLLDRMSGPGDTLGPAGAGAALGGLVVLLAIAPLLRALGGSVSTALWESVRCEVEARGGFLEARGTGIGRRYARAMLAYGAYFALVVLVTAIDGEMPRPRTGAWTVGGFVGCLLAALALLVVAVFWMLRRRGVSLRSVSLLTGLATSLAMLFLLSPVFLWRLADLGVEQVEPILLRAERYASGTAAPADGHRERIAATPREMARALSSLRWLARVELLAIAFVTGIGLVMLAWAVRLARRARPELRRMRARPDRGLYGAAVDEPAGRPLRFALGGAWLLVAILTTSSVGWALLSGLRAAVPGLAFPAVDLARSSALVVALALGRPLDETWTRSTVRLGWCLYGATMLSLSALSVGHLLWTRHRLRRRLELAACDPTAIPTAVVERVGRLLEKAGVERVVLSRSDSAGVFACAHAIGFFRPRLFVQISSAALDHFDAEAVTALIAHELAHHRLGHCRRERFHRLLGRLTFVGDGFVRALGHSLGDEQAADDEAVRLLGGPRSLVRALRLRRNLAAIARLRVPANGKDGAELLPAAKREPSAWAIFWLQYAHAMETHYWHPGSDRRIARLAAPRGGNDVSWS